MRGPHAYIAPPGQTWDLVSYLVFPEVRGSSTSYGCITGSYNWNTVGSSSIPAAPSSSTKLSDARINELKAQCPGTALFKVVIDGSEATARFYKTVGNAQYSSALLPYGDSTNGWCGSTSETGTYHCGSSALFDGNTGWCGLSSTSNRGTLTHCGVSDGFHGLANGGHMYDRCNGKHSATSGYLAVYFKCNPAPTPAPTASPTAPCKLSKICICQTNLMWMDDLYYVSPA